MGQSWKIAKVEWEGMLDFRRVHPKNWDLTRMQMEVEYNILLPAWDELPAKDRDQLQVCLSYITIKIYLTDGTMLVYQFRPGYITDLASVPKALRSLVDNDALELLLAALVHDANFGGQLLSFGASNTIFRQMIRDPGNGSWWLSTKCYIAVSLPAARRIYENKNDSELKRNRERCGFEFKPAPANKSLGRF